MLLAPDRHFNLVLGFVAERCLLMVRYLGRLVRTRPKTAILVLALLLFVGTGAGFYLYALQQWHAAQETLKKDRFTEARRTLDFCLLVWPRSFPVHLLAARAARLNSDFEAAKAHLQQCLKIQREAPATTQSELLEATQLEFLLIRAQTGEDEEVESALFDLVEKNHPQTALILETMARVYMHNLRYGPAYSCLTKWMEVAPSEAKPYHWRGWVQERMDYSKEAMEDYKQALARDPDLFPVRIRVAEMLLEDNLPHEAIPHLERLIKQQPDNADVMVRLGHCRYLQGQVEEARRLLEAGVKKLPDDSHALYFLAKLELHEGRPAEAERWLQHAREVDPSDTEVLYTLHTALQLQGRQQEAGAVMDEYNQKTALVLQTNRLLKEDAKKPLNDPTVLSELGVLLIRVGRDSLGLGRLEQALVRDPGHQPTLKALAEYYENKGQPEKAAAYRSRLTATDTKADTPKQDPKAGGSVRKSP